jgi:hypothetical protein
MVSLLLEDIRHGLYTVILGAERMLQDFERRSRHFSMFVPLEQGKFSHCDGSGQPLPNHDAPSQVSAPCSW